MYPQSDLINGPQRSDIHILGRANNLSVEELLIKLNKMTLSCFLLITHYTEHGSLVDR